MCTDGDVQYSTVLHSMSGGQSEGEEYLPTTYRATKRNTYCVVCDATSSVAAPLIINAHDSRPTRPDQASLVRRRGGGYGRATFLLGWLAQELHADGYDTSARYVHLHAIGRRQTSMTPDLGRSRFC